MRVSYLMIASISEVTVLSSKLNNNSTSNCASPPIKIQQNHHDNNVPCSNVLEFKQNSILLLSENKNKNALTKMNVFSLNFRSNTSTFIDSFLFIFWDIKIIYFVILNINNSFLGVQYK